MTEDTLDPRLVTIFETELRFQVRQVQHSLHHVNSLSAGAALETDEFWFGLNAALNAMASIGNILWPRQDRKHAGTGDTRTSSKLRGRLLRKELGVAEQSVTTLHDVRNGFAHFDERVDRWYAQSESKAFADLCIGASDRFTGLPESAFARHFDPATDVVSVFGVSVNFRKAVDEISTLDALLRARHARRFPMLTYTSQHGETT